MGLDQSYVGKSEDKSEKSEGKKWRHPYFWPVKIDGQRDGCPGFFMAFLALYGEVVA